jgi:hypothetical protein
MRKLSWFVLGVIAGLAAAAISKEMEKPAAERTWKGTIAGVPYNFNISDWADIAREYWNPDSDCIFSPHAIGMGWGVNFAALWRWVEGLMGEPQPRASQRREPVER